MLFAKIAANSVASARRSSPLDATKWRATRRTRPGALLDQLALAQERYDLVDGAARGLAANGARDLLAPLARRDPRAVVGESSDGAADLDREVGVGHPLGDGGIVERAPQLAAERVEHAVAVQHGEQERGLLAADLRQPPHQRLVRKPLSLLDVAEHDRIHRALEHLCGESLDGEVAAREHARLVEIVLDGLGGSALAGHCGHDSQNEFA
jgi:hypothetical protein